MRGKTNEEILAERQRAIATVQEQLKEEFEVIDSFFEDAPVGVKPMWYLAKSIELLADADVACFVGEWNKARGCLIENTCAHEYGIKMIYVD